MSDENILAEIKPEAMPGQTLDLDQVPVPQDWKDWISYMALRIVLYAAKNPWQFLSSVLLFISPLLIISAFLAHRLIKDIENRENKKKQKQRREANMAKVKGHTKTD